MNLLSRQQSHVSILIDRRLPLKRIFEHHVIMSHVLLQVHIKEAYNVKLHSQDFNPQGEAD